MEKVKLSPAHVFFFQEIGANVDLGLNWLPTWANQSDNPSRRRRIQNFQSVPFPWYSRFDHGDFSGFDSIGVTSIYGFHEWLLAHAKKERQKRSKKKRLCFKIAAGGRRRLSNKCEQFGRGSLHPGNDLDDDAADQFWTGVNGPLDQEFRKTVRERVEALTADTSDGFGPLDDGIGPDDDDF